MIPMHLSPYAFNEVQHIVDYGDKHRLFLSICPAFFQISEHQKDVIYWSIETDGLIHCNNGNRVFGRWRA